MRRPVAAEGQGPVRYDPSEDEMARQFPTLVGFLTDDRWDDGKRRKTGTLMLVHDEGRVKAWVHDLDGARAAWCSAESLWGLLLTVDVGLREDRLEWRADRRK